jgi:hypothetical protein
MDYLMAFDRKKELKQVASKSSASDTEPVSELSHQPEVKVQKQELENTLKFGR